MTLAFGIERVGRRHFLVWGALLMMAFNFAVGGLMASYGHFGRSKSKKDGCENADYEVPDGVDGSPTVRWQVKGPPAKGIIACSYLFVAMYGFTW